ncbi:MAG: four helix bundle protein [Cyclobacteriaceae bacterium]
MHRYKELDVWKRSMALAKSIYDLTSEFPDEEKFGIISQMRRSSVSVPSNIAEGAGRNGNKEFANFLGIAMGSLFELETQVLLSKEIGLAKVEVGDLVDEIQSISNMIYKLRNNLN